MFEEEALSMRFRVTLEGRLISSSGEIDEEAVKALTLSMGELNVLDSGRNAAIHLHRGTGAITISCAVEADDLKEAVLPASDNIQLALRVGKIGTPDWPQADDAAWRVEFIRSNAEVLAPA